MLLLRPRIAYTIPGLRNSRGIIIDCSVMRLSMLHADSAGRERSDITEASTRLCNPGREAGSIRSDLAGLHCLRDGRLCCQIPSWSALPRFSLAVEKWCQLEYLEEISPSEEISQSMRNKTLIMFAAISALLLTLWGPQSAFSQEYQPTLGQEGKDVIWMPTPAELVAAMLDMAKVTPSDSVIDLGSGDGRIVIAAAKRGATALGVEYNPDMVELSRRNAQKEGVAAKATFMQGDIFETDFSRATVLTMYLLPDLNIRLRPKILAMKPGTRVVSHAFSMGDWEPDQTREEEGRTAYFWVVPAKVAGAWSLRSNTGSAELTLQQTYQKIEGSLRMDGKDLPLKDAKLDGDRIRFTVAVGNPTVWEYSGRVHGDTIDGTTMITGGAAAKWTAERRPKAR